MACITEITNVEANIKRLVAIANTSQHAADAVARTRVGEATRALPFAQRTPVTTETLARAGIRAGTEGASRARQTARAAVESWQARRAGTVAESVASQADADAL